MRELHLFAGIGGGILAGKLLGHECVGAVEIDPFCRRVLMARQLDGSIPMFPIYGDIRECRFDQGGVDVVCGGFPCQDISLARAGRQEGLNGPQSSLWFEMLRVVREVGPRFVFVENVPGLLRRGLHTVLSGLADLGFNAEWCVLSAAACGAPHLRKRLWILASHPDRSGLAQREGERGDSCSELQAALGGHRWEPEPGVGVLDDGFPNRVAALRALGNAQVPIQAATAFRVLMRRLM